MTDDVARTSATVSGWGDGAAAPRPRRGRRAERGRPVSAAAVDEAAMRTAEAVGAGVDDPGGPHAACVVCDGEVVCEAVSPGLRTLPPDQAGDVVRAVRFMAWASWAAQRRGGAVA